MKSYAHYSLARSIANRNGTDEKQACCVCGATNATLYKNGDGRICRACRKKQMTNTGGDD